MTSSFLRLNRDFIIEDENFNSLVKLLKKYTNIKELTFFPSVGHSVHKLEVFIPFFEKFKERYKVLHSMGIRVGINQHPTVGYFLHGTEGILSNDAPYSVSKTGEINVGNFCGSNDKTLEYIEKLYTLTASANPDFIFVDDDIRYNLNMCYCDECIGKFENKYAHFSKNNIDKSRENLVKLIEENQDVKKDWLDFSSDLVAKIYQRIEKAVHKVNKDIELGFMTTDYFTEKEMQKYTTALKGGSKTVRVRPGGGLWNDADILGVINKSASINIQTTFLPEYVNKIDAEIECFPSQGLAKSNRYLALEYTLYLASGCTGIAYNQVLPSFDNSAYKNEFENRFKIIDGFNKFIEKRGECVKGTKFTGACVYYGEDNGNDFSRKWSGNYVNVEMGLSLSGVPVCFRSYDADCYVLTKKNAENLSIEQLKQAFLKPVFITAEALQVLNERGLKDYTGVEIIEKFTTDTVERGEIKSFFGVEFKDGQLKRDGVQAFYWMRDYEPSYTLKAQNGGQTVSSIYSINKKYLGIGSLLTKNKFGKKVAVVGYNPFTYRESYFSKQELRYMFDYLMGNEHINSCHKVMLYEKNTPDNNKCLILSNFSYDDAENVSVFSGEKYKAGKLYCFNGQKEVESKVRVEKTDGGYNYIISKIQGLTAGYLLLKK